MTTSVRQTGNSVPRVVVAERFSSSKTSHAGMPTLGVLKTSICLFDRNIKRLRERAIITCPIHAAV